MAKHEDHRAITLSISLPKELARVVDQRVKSGLYSSASELIREALRLLLRGEAVEPSSSKTGGPKSAAAQRLATAFELADAGAAMRAEKARRGDVSVAATTLETGASQQEVGPGLRYAPERLARLTLGD